MNKRKEYVRPAVKVVTLGSELMANFNLASVGTEDKASKKFIGLESFEVKESMPYFENKEFWDDWEHGAD